MSQNSSKESKSAEVTVVLSNFQGLQYDINKDTEYEVIASYVNNILNNDRIQTNRKSKPKIIIKISIDTADENEISELFLNPLLLTLMKHENGQAEQVGRCNIDLSMLCSTKCEIIKSNKQFSSEKMGRKILFDIKASTNFPLLKFNYDNCIKFTINYVHHFDIDTKSDIEIGVHAPYKTSKIDLFKLDSIELHKGANLNATFKSVIFTSEASMAFHDDIRACNNILMELLIDNKEHLFGSINCEELLYVGQRTICSSIPLYRFDNDVFKSCFQRNSIFYKPESQLLSKNKRISRKTQNIQIESTKFLEDIKALNDAVNQIYAVVQIELEKPLNEEVPLMHTSQFSNNFANKKLQLKFNRINYFESFHKMHCNEVFTKEDYITSKITVLWNQYQNSFDDETFACHVTSDIANLKKSQSSNQHKLILAEIYKSLEMIDKSEDIFLYALHKYENSESEWLDYAIFNAKQEDYDKMSNAVDEILKLNPQSMISNVLKAYLLFKLHKYPECLNLLSHLKTIHGEIEELCIMQYVINAILVVECNPVESNSKKNSDIEGIYNRLDLLWYSTRDDCFLSWQNLFVRSAIFFIKIGCYDVAELCLGEYYRMFGINVNYLYLLAAIDSSKGNFKEALYHLNRISESDIVNHNVNYSKIVKSIILNLLHTKNFKKAAEIFNTYIQTESCDNFLILFLLGSHFNRTNEFVIAKEFLIQAAKLFHCHVVFQELGKCFMGLKMLDLAEKPFLNALQFEINDIDSLVSLGEIYKIQGRYDAINFCDYNIQYNNNNNINNVH